MEFIDLTKTRYTKILSIDTDKKFDGIKIKVWRRNILKEVEIIFKEKIEIKNINWK